MVADDGPVRQPGFGGGGGSVITRDWLCLRQHPLRVVSLLVQLVSFNALAMLAVGRSPGAGSPTLPGITLLAVAGLLMVSVLEGVLETERPSLAHWASLPRSLPWVFARKALLAAILGIAGALPTVIYVTNSLPSWHSAVAVFSYAAACVCLLAFFHAAFWMRRVNPNVPASVPQRLLRLTQVALIAAILQAGFGSGPALVAPSLTLAVAFAFSFWHALPERAAWALAPNSSRPPSLTAIYALGTLVVLQVMRGFVIGMSMREGSSLAHATTLAFLTSGIVVLGGSILWLWFREVPALAAQLGLGPGKGLRVILREALLWTVPAVLFNQTYWVIANQRVAEAIQPASEPPATMTVLAGSPIALVGVGMIAAPVLEELLFRGMLYRTLRMRWTLVPSLLLSTVVFLMDHTVAAAIPVFFGSVCFTLALERSRSLYAAMLAHAVYNGVLVLQLLSR
jgi:membrane protease YdiL (CAAX protease family)